MQIVRKTRQIIGFDKEFLDTPPGPGLILMKVELEHFDATHRSQDYDGKKMWHARLNGNGNASHVSLQTKQREKSDAAGNVATYPTSWLPS